MHRVLTNRVLFERIVEQLSNDDRWALDQALAMSKAATFCRPAWRHESLLIEVPQRWCRRWLPAIVASVKNPRVLFEHVSSMCGKNRLVAATLFWNALSDARQRVVQAMSLERYFLLGFMDAFGGSLDSVRFFWTQVCDDTQRQELAAADEFLRMLVVVYRARVDVFEWLLLTDAVWQRWRPSAADVFPWAFDGGDVATIEYWWRRLRVDERASVLQRAWAYPMATNAFTSVTSIALVQEFANVCPPPVHAANMHIQRFVFSPLDYSADQYMEIFHIFYRSSLPRTERRLILQHFLRHFYGATGSPFGCPILRRLPLAEFDEGIFHSLPDQLRHAIAAERQRWLPGSNKRFFARDD